jgi:hypothetical protein
MLNRHHLTNGAYPLVITNSCVFLPLLNMCYGLAWHLHCDCVLATTISPGLAHFQTFLAHGAMGITESTYLGTAIPGRFCPNFGYHFQTINSLWPTLAEALPPFFKQSQVSLDAQDYVIITTNVHSDHPAPIQALLTQDEVLVVSNHHNQPAQLAPPVATGMTSAPAADILAATAPTPPATVLFQAPASILTSTCHVGTPAPLHPSLSLAPNHRPHQIPLAWQTIYHQAIHLWHLPHSHLHKHHLETLWPQLLALM